MSAPIRSRPSLSEPRAPDAPTLASSPSPLAPPPLQLNIFFASVKAYTSDEGVTSFSSSAPAGSLFDPIYGNFMEPRDTPNNAQLQRFLGVGGVFYLAAFFGDVFTTNGDDSNSATTRYAESVWGCASMDDVQIWTGDGSDGTATSAIPNFVGLKVLAADNATALATIPLDPAFIGSRLQWQWAGTSAFRNITASVYASSRLPLRRVLSASAASSGVLFGKLHSCARSGHFSRC